jgi:hypothetical protein
MTQQQALFGVLAQFESAEDLVAAARAMRESGYRRFESYSPFPVHGLAEVMGFRTTWLPLLVLVGGVLGALGGYGLQYWAAAIAYPLNIGGRPLNSWPMFVPITFEMTSVGAVCFGPSADLGDEVHAKLVSLVVHHGVIKPLLETCEEVSSCAG